MESLYKFREISNECYYLLHKFIKKLTKLAKIQKNNWKGVKILENYGGKLTVICRGNLDNQHFTNNIQQTAKIKKPGFEILRVWTKNEEKLGTL